MFDTNLLALSLCASYGFVVFFGIFIGMSKQEMNAVETFIMAFVINPLIVLFVLCLWPFIFLVLVPWVTERIFEGYAKKRREGKA